MDSTTLFSDDIHSAGSQGGAQGGAQTLKQVHRLTLLLWLVLHFRDSQVLHKFPIVLDTYILECVHVHTYVYCAQPMSCVCEYAHTF